MHNNRGDKFIFIQRQQYSETLTDIQGSFDGTHVESHTHRTHTPTDTIGERGDWREDVHKGAR